MKNNHSETLHTLKLFLKIFVPLFLLVSAVSLLYYLSEARSDLQVLMQQKKYNLQTQVDPLKHEFQYIVSDLMDVSSHQQLRLTVDGSPQADYTALSKEFLAFSQNKKMYDQVRFLDETGMEIVRVNFNQGSPVIVPQAQLQSKAGRYYFKDTFQLAQGEVFISPFDLNIEGSVLEQPLKPMIRFGMPIFNSKGEKRGIVILNYLGGQLIDYFEKTSQNSLVPSFNMLINSDGYFLKGMRSEDEWGFMLPERKDKTFAHLFPDQWDEITRTPSGQFMSDQGLFTFTTYYPLTEGLKTSSGSSEAFGSSVRLLNADQYNWKIVSFVPHDAILGMTQQLSEVLLLTNAFFGLLGGVGIWLLSKSILRRQDAEYEIEHMAHFDLLTGLPNRPLLYDRMGVALANAYREKNLLSVFFIDLDGFKGVNDQFGHEAGDVVLKEVALRLQQCIRATDTAARIGGDEFVLLLPSITKLQDAEMIAAKVISALSKPITLNAQLEHSIGASVGVAFYPDDGSTQDALLNNADAAMYVAKQNGKNNYHFYS